MILSIRRVSKSFGAKRVLDGVSFEAASGAATGLLGRNGAGKTTTMRIILGLFPADSGSVLFDGEPMGARRVRVGYLPEERGLYLKQPVGVQLRYLARLRGLSGRDARATVARWTARLSMDDTLNKKLETLSKGNQQKIQMAAALLGEPDVLVLDEPFSGLDPINAQLLKDVAREQVAAGRLVIFSSHQMAQIEEFCDNIAMIHAGRIVLSGSLAHIKRAYPRNFLRLAIEDGAYGLAQAALAGLGGAVRHARMDSRGMLLTISDPSAKKAVLAALVSFGVPVERFEVVEPSLEEIFLEKAGQEA